MGRSAKGQKAFRVLDAWASQHVSVIFAVHKFKEGVFNEVHSNNFWRIVLVIVLIVKSSSSFTTLRRITLSVPVRYSWTILTNFSPWIPILQCM